VIERTYDPPLQEERVGWKLFQTKGGKLYPAARGIGPYRSGAWLDEVEHRERPPCPESSYIASRSLKIYRTGWHVFQTRKDAEEALRCFSARGYPDLTVRKVRYKGIVVSGREEHPLPGYRGLTRGTCGGHPVPRGVTTDLTVSIPTIALNVDVALDLFIEPDPRSPEPDPRPNLTR